MTPRMFRDRTDAGRQLAKKLGLYANRADVAVLALPRGGVPVAYEVAVALGAPLDVFVVRKLGAPDNEELAVGAIATGGTRYVDRALAARLGLDEDVIDEIARREEHELRRRERLYRKDLPPVDVRGKVAILVDDGLATGATMRAAVEALRSHAPSKIVVAVPVAAPEVCELFSRIADESVCVLTPEAMMAVGLWYTEFDQTTDEEVSDLLRASRAHAHRNARSA